MPKLAIFPSRLDVKDNSSRENRPFRKETHRSFHRSVVKRQAVLGLSEPVVPDLKAVDDLVRHRFGHADRRMAAPPTILRHLTTVYGLQCDLRHRGTRRRAGQQKARA